ncbi:MAG TPA: shikimate dehydrogenase [Desulfobacteria bacterium]|nr:shikimate dehydrogenase [Desulfobacteria bacterium]
MTSAINGRTRVFGIFGWPVEHTFSPMMHNSAFDSLGLDCVYVPFPVNPDDLGKAVEGIRSLGISGVNVTIPHKSTVIKYLDEVSPEAKLIGAVNTITNKGGFLTGYNTDAMGFVKSLKLDGGTDPAGKRVMILGAGGAARAVTIQLALSGIKELTIVSPVAEEIASLSEVITGSLNIPVKGLIWDEQVISNCLEETDILIHATPLGMHPDTDKMPPVEVGLLPGHALVCDLIYNPGETLLLRKAAERGLKTQNGIGMLLYQGAIAFELWTGQEPPVEIMRDALKRALAK